MVGSIKAVYKEIDEYVEEGYMNIPSIDRINYRNQRKNIEFEIIDLHEFFLKRPHDRLKQDVRLNFWMVMYITKGKGRHYVDFRYYDIKKGDIVFVRKNQVHHFEVNMDLQGYLMHLNEPFFYQIEGFKGDIFLDFVDNAFGSPVLSFDTDIGTTNRMLLNLIHKEYSRPTEELNVELIAALFQGFILSIREQVKGNEKVFLSKDYVNFKEYRRLVEKYFTKTRNVEDYAEMMHLSKKTVNQATRKVAGLSAKQFIIDRTILEIKRYLSQGELMNYEIADVLGFGDAANMTKFFKHYEEISPKEFREISGK